MTRLHNSGPRTDRTVPAGNGEVRSGEIKKFRKKFGKLNRVSVVKEYLIRASVGQYGSRIKRATDIVG